MKRFVPSQWKYSLLRVLPTAPSRSLLFRSHTGTWPSLSDPKTFSEKVNWRIVKDRRAELVWTCDKLRMKERAGRIDGLRVPETLWVGTDVRELVDQDLPSRWVLKPNNGSGRVHLGGGVLDAVGADALARTTRDWLKPWQAIYLREWAYAHADAVFVVEEFIDAFDADDQGAVPVDYKFHVFDGEVRFVQVDAGRYAGDDRRRGFFTPDWEPIHVAKRLDNEAPHIDSPKLLDGMLEAARTLAGDFDFLRVDLYAPSDEIWFGEVSPYPSSGLTLIHPASVDQEWGAMWHLPEQLR